MQPLQRVATHASHTCALVHASRARVCVCVCSLPPRTRARRRRDYEKNCTHASQRTAQHAPRFAITYAPAAKYVARAHRRPLGMCAACVLSRRSSSTRASRARWADQQKHFVLMCAAPNSHSHANHMETRAANIWMASLRRARAHVLWRRAA